MGAKKSIAFGDNCFDWIRLTAAMFVVFSHTVSHLQLNAPSWIMLTHSLFPGVIILFYVSGYLITASVDRAQNCGEWKKYVVSSILRIYPALIFAFLITIVILLVTYNTDATPFQWSEWIVCQLTIGQAYVPEFLKGYATGSPNGSLWTIAIEIQWYVIAWLINKRVKNMTKLQFVITFITSVIISCLYPISKDVIGLLPYGRQLWLAIDLTPIPYFYIMLLGAYTYHHRQEIIPLAQSTGI